MSKYHGDQYWTQLRQRDLDFWLNISEDDFDEFRSVRRANEMRMRNERERARRDRAELLPQVRNS